MDTENKYKKFGKDRVCSSGDICIVNGKENPFPAICDAAYRQCAGGGPTDNMHKKFGKDHACGSGDILADRQTDRHTHHNTSQPLPPAK